MIQDDTSIEAALLRLSTAAFGRASEAEKQVPRHGLVIHVNGVPHLNPAARVALEERRLGLDAIKASRHFSRGWLTRLWGRK